MSKSINSTGVDTAQTPSNDSPRKLDVSKVTGPILLHLLSTEVRFPRLFLVRCRLTLGRFKKTIDPRFQPELIELAALPLWVYLNLKRRIGQAKAYEIMRVAILTGGIAQWNLAYRAAVNKRTFDNLCDAEIDVNRTGPTKWNAKVGRELVVHTPRYLDLKAACRSLHDHHRLPFGGLGPVHVDFRVAKVIERALVHRSSIG